MAIVVRRATPDDADEMATVLADAFDAADYPWTTYTVEASNRRDRLVGLFRVDLAQLALPYGASWVVEMSGVTVGAAVWMVSDAEVPGEIWDRVNADSAALVGNRAGAAMEAEALLEPYRPEAPHSLLATMGVAAHLQGRGLGRALLAPGLAHVDERHLPAYLETSSQQNVAFYEGVGFRVGHQVRIAEGLVVWTMHRPAA